VTNRIARTARVLAVVSTFSVVAWMAMPGVSQAAARKNVHTTTPKYYLSLGDSYSVGYQPVPTSEATAGYTGYVAKKMKLTLENWGCGGATTASIIGFSGVCGTPDTYGPPAIAGTVGPETAGDSQVQNAVAFIETPANFGEVSLVTVSISGNDVTSCATASNPITCVEGVTAEIKTNVLTVVDDLSTALDANGDSTAPIVGLTYPDVILGSWVYPDLPPLPSNAAGETLAVESAGAFDALINPALKLEYTSVSTGKFVDVTDAAQFGGNGTAIPTLATEKQVGVPAGDLVGALPHGVKVPESVADICKLTYYCALGNIHSKTKGYTDIGKLIVAALH
jgi:hypothetical protein